MHPIDVTSPALDAYYRSIGIIDQRADAYMHNLLFLSMMHYQELFSYPEILKELATNYDKRLPLPVERIAMSMLEPQKFSGEYIAQYIKKRD